MRKKRVINSLINIGSYEKFIKSIIKLSEDVPSSYICVSNVHMIIEAYKDKLFSNIVNNANIATPDGMPIAKSIQLIYGINQDRVAGMDLMPDLMKECKKSHKKIFLYGSTDDILKKIIEKSKKEFPNLKIDGFSPPFRELTGEEKSHIVQIINSQNPDFVFVALGCPKQERWMAEHKNKINSCMIGLGGAFEVYANVKHRAPLWMQKYSLEWLYRLLQDPKRLWKRYLITNTLFLILIFSQFITIRILKINAKSSSI